MCEFYQLTYYMRTYILSQLNTVFENESLGLYRNDGLGIFRNFSWPKIERKKNTIVHVFKECVLLITTKASLKVVNFLDIQQDLINGTYGPYRKRNNNPMYVDINSNHPPSIKKQILKPVSKRISKFPSNKGIFNNNTRTYNDSLKRCGFQENPDFIPETPSDSHANERRKRRRKIIWFNPPYSMNVKAKIGKVFLSLA